jgi:hypothetical protein
MLARRQPPQLLRFEEQLERVVARLQGFDELDCASGKVRRLREPESVQDADSSCPVGIHHTQVFFTQVFLSHLPQRS